MREKPSKAVSTKAIKTKPISNKELKENLKKSK